MKKISKKMIISIFTLVLVFIALGTTTFAWFTIGNQVSAGSFTTEVKGGDGIEVSFDGEEWQGNISQTISAVTLEHLTTNDGLTMRRMDDTPVVYDSNTANPYLEQKIYFRSKTSQSIYLESFGARQGVDSVSPLTYVNTTNWTSDVTIPEFNLFASNRYIFDPFNAMKVSFEKYGSYAADTTTKVKADGTASLAYAFELSDQNVTFTGADASFTECAGFDASVTEYYRLVEGKYVYVPNVTRENFSDFEYVLYKFNTYTTVGTQANTNWGPVSNAPDSLVRRYAQAKGYTLTSTITPFTSFQPVYMSSSTAVADTWLNNTENDTWFYTVVTMRIWLEGWDADCINSLLAKSNATIAFKFTTTRSTVTA